MKKCPNCNRTYEDDTLFFCLDDGARLSRAYDPQATVVDHDLRDQNPPSTLILSPEQTSPNQNLRALHSTIPAVAPLAYPREASQTQRHEKRGSKHWIIIGGMLVLLFVGLMIVLGYFAWKANRNSTPHSSSVGSAAPTNDTPANANRNSEAATTGKPSLEWLNGVWAGEGYQTDTKTTWAVRLTVQDGIYSVAYPTIPCDGRWTLIDYNSSEARFVEVLTNGTNRCANQSHVTIQKVNDAEISCKYTYARSRNVIATVVMSKK